MLRSMFRKHDLLQADDSEKFFCNRLQNRKFAVIVTPSSDDAQVAELVDALVSGTSE